MGGWERTLNIASAVSGFAGTLGTFIQGSHAWAYAGLFTMAVLLIAGFIVGKLQHRSAISVDFQKFTVSLENNGALAHARKEYEFRVHRSGLSEWVHRNISADGQIGGFTWNGDAIPAADMVKRCNDLEIKTRNPYPWPTGPKHRGTLAYTLTDSFPNNVEYIQYTADIPTKLAVICVIFPSTRPCMSAHVIRRADGVNETLDIVDRDPRGLSLQVEIPKPKGGYEYSVYWHW